MQTVSELWQSHDENAWIDASARYWDVQTVKNNKELETRMNELEPSRIERLGEREWYDFLKCEYFPWKFTGNYLPNRLSDLETNNLADLFSVKKRLFAFDRANIREGLRTARRINGLGPAGASGLLAVLFPERYGTCDKFGVKSLCQIEVLPERGELLAMVRRDSKGKETVSLSENDAVLLIDIMRRKAAELNAMFGGGRWTPRKVDMVLYAIRETH